MKKMLLAFLLSLAVTMPQGSVGSALPGGFTGPALPGGSVGPALPGGSAVSALHGGSAVSALPGGSAVSALPGGSVAEALSRDFAGTLEISAQSACLIDANSGMTLFERNAGERRLIASTTKIMTALTALDLCDLNDMVVIPKEAAGVEGSSMYLQEGQIRSASEILHGLMLMSGNDAAVAIAVHCSGTVEAFVEEMNRKAKELELNDTSFENPHGLDGEFQYSTAADMAKLAAAAMDNPAFAGIVSKQYAKVGGVSVRNHNRLLSSLEGCDGVKTGYTKSAGRCLVSSVTRNGRRLIAVTLNAGDDWNDHTKMIEYGFSEYSESVSYQKGDLMASVPVFTGGEEYAEVIVKDKLSLTLTKDEARRIRIDISIPRYFWNPVTAGTSVGKIRIVLEDRILGETELVVR